MYPQGPVLNVEPTTGRESATRTDGFLHELRHASAQSRPCSRHALCARPSTSPT